MKIFNLLLIFLLVGCASTQSNKPIETKERNYSDELLQKLELSNYAKNNYLNKEERVLKKLDRYTYKRILKNKESGVYQHPFYPSKVITIYREGANISEELEQYKLTKSFKFQKGTYRFSNRVGQSASGVHFIAQNRAKNDANVILLNKKLVTNDKHLHHSYFVLLHEIAHSLDSQFEYLIIENGSAVLSENASEIVASILGYQTFTEEGFDFNYYKKFLKKEKRITKTNQETHRTQHIFPMMTELIEENKEWFFNMTKPEIEEFSMVMSKEIFNYDFSEKKGLQNITSSSYKDSKQLKIDILQKIKDKYQLY